jgi:hypothetical protein
VPVSGIRDSRGAVEVGRVTGAGVETVNHCETEHEREGVEMNVEEQLNVVSS